MADGSVVVVRSVEVTTLQDHRLIDDLPLIDLFRFQPISMFSFVILSRTFVVECGNGTLFTTRRRHGQNTEKTGGCSFEEQWLIMYRVAQKFWSFPVSVSSDVLPKAPVQSLRFLRVRILSLQ